MKLFGSKPNKPQSYVTISSRGEIRVTADSVPEAKLAIKELKLKKKALLLAKRQLMDQERAIRASYTDKIRRQGSKFQGPGIWGQGRFVRAAQTVARDKARKDLAKQLAPLEEERQRLEAMVAAVDQAILKVESYIIKNS